MRRKVWVRREIVKIEKEGLGQEGMSTCVCNNNAMFSDRAISRLLPSPYAGHVNLAATKPWQFMPKWKDGITFELIIFRV